MTADYNALKRKSVGKRKRAMDYEDAERWAGEMSADYNARKRVSASKRKRVLDYDDASIQRIHPVGSIQV
jgi:hypothetical protein